MIDSHMHLEQKDYHSDRDQVIEQCKEAGLKAIVTCCTNPSDFRLTLDIARKNKGFVFATAGLHPLYIRDFSGKQVADYLDLVRKNKDWLVGFGEVGLDYFHVKEPEWQEKQKKQFKEMIAFSKDIAKPLVIHCREAYSECLDILEKEKAKDVLLHMFGDNKMVAKIIRNDWFVSTNTILLRSKTHKKIVKDMPLEKLMLETDSPWLGFGQRNTPLSIKSVAEKIAEIKRVPFEKVWLQCAENSVSFYKLPIKL